MLVAAADAEMILLEGMLFIKGERAKAADFGVMTIMHALVAEGSMLVNVISADAKPALLVKLVGKVSKARLAQGAGAFVIGFAYGGIDHIVLVDEIAAGADALSVKNVASGKGKVAGEAAKMVLFVGVAKEGKLVGILCFFGLIE